MISSFVVPVISSRFGSGLGAKIIGFEGINRTKIFEIGKVIKGSKKSLPLLGRNYFSDHVPNSKKTSGGKFFSNMMYILGGGIGTLGVVRGGQEYHYNIRDQSCNYSPIDYLNCLIYGLIFGSIYLNPATTCVGILKEFERAKMLKEKIPYDQNKYYSNQYIGLSCLSHAKSL